MDTSSAQPEKKNVLNSKPAKIATQAGLFLIAFAIGYGLHYFISADARNAQSQVANLESEKDTLAKDKEALEEKNENLSTSIDTLQGQLPSGETTSQVPIETEDSEPVTTKITISEVKNLPGTAFGLPGKTPLKGDFKVVYAKIENSSMSEQKYDRFQFTAITKTGVVIEPQVYAPYDSQGLWYESTLAPGGVQDIVLLFPQDQDIIVLKHAPSSVSVTIPEPVN